MVSKRSRFNLSIYTGRAVVKVPPIMAKVRFWLSVMKPATKETTLRVWVLVISIFIYMLECLITHRGDNEDDSCPTILRGPGDLEISEATTVE